LRDVEIFALHADDDPDSVARLAAMLHAETGQAWLTVPTREPNRVAAALEAAGLEFVSRTEALMATDLRTQPVHTMAEPYRLRTEVTASVVYVSVEAADGTEAAHGYAGLTGPYAVADRILTEPEHRRRPLGTAVMAAIADAAIAAGATQGLLVGSAEGQALYRSPLDDRRRRAGREAPRTRPRRLQRSHAGQAGRQARGGRATAADVLRRRELTQLRRQHQRLGAELFGALGTAGQVVLTRGRLPFGHFGPNDRRDLVLGRPSPDRRPPPKRSPGPARSARLARRTGPHRYRSSSGTTSSAVLDLPGRSPGLGTLAARPCASYVADRIADDGSTRPAHRNHAPTSAFAQP
jgi:GNAT superfamily N-acetyltransferase